jgi:hypothetical protein
VRRILIFAICVGLNNLISPIALASCSSVPDKPLITFKSDVSGIDFTVSPASTGCTATQLNFTYAYYDQTLQTWEAWTKWAIGSSTGKSFSFKVPSIKGKSRVTVGLTAGNKWGTSALTRENQIGNGIEFPTSNLESIFVKDLVSINSKIGTLQLKFRHPEFIECGVHSGLFLDNCRFAFEYDLTSDVVETKSMLGTLSEFIYIDVVDDKGTKIGFVTRDIYQFSFSSKNGYFPISASANVKVETRAKFRLAPSSQCEKLCREISSKEFILRPISQEEATRRQAAIEANAKREAEEATRREVAQQAGKKLTITCKKGSSIKKVTGESPTCPKGYKNPLARYLTFQAFSTCQLYKKDALVGGAQLGDGGRTLILDAFKERSYQINGLTDADYKCATRILKMPEFVAAKVGSTRAIDGIQSAQWGMISAFWNYHPDNGLDITFNSR